MDFGSNEEYKIEDDEEGLGWEGVELGLQDLGFQGGHPGAENADEEELMHVVRKDGNNQMYPIAMAIVEFELKDNWTLFLELLTNIIGKPEDKGWIFISNRQKRLTESMDMLFPGVEHRYCMRHMYSNFQKVHKGKELKDLMWGATSDYTVPEFRAKMMEVRAVDVNAHEWLLKEPPRYWARRKSGRPKKARRKGAKESLATMINKGNVYKCRKCNQPGHNARTCKFEVGQSFISAELVTRETSPCPLIPIGERMPRGRGEPTGMGVPEVMQEDWKLVKGEWQVGFQLLLVLLKGYLQED
ncbi:hypothetical protein RHMOL_Rhmol09G0075800 [Rhododendron molle]|uniref:Uncharacterized protein n=1 Tax=Rhododendron molle TaxID=49168 RepID=A0ACC0MBY2_RHOML|nr:hypothetical protein RHMOL_Rhmol09G0075800 [Rhododendron molle]